MATIQENVREELNRLFDSSPELTVKVPEHTLDALRRYVLDGLEPGGFLQAVLTNDLMEACGRADVENSLCLPHIATFIYNCTPSHSHGSRDRYEAWIQEKRKNWEVA